MRPVKVNSPGTHAPPLHMPYMFLYKTETSGSDFVVGPGVSPVMRRDCAALWIAVNRYAYRAFQSTTVARRVMPVGAIRSHLGAEVSPDRREKSVDMA